MEPKYIYICFSLISNTIHILFHSSWDHLSSNIDDRVSSRDIPRHPNLSVKSAPVLVVQPRGKAGYAHEEEPEEGGAHGPFAEGEIEYPPDVRVPEANVDHASRVDGCSGRHCSVNIFFIIL